MNKVNNKIICEIGWLSLFFVVLVILSKVDFINLQELLFLEFSTTDLFFWLGVLVMVVFSAIGTIGIAINVDKGGQSIYRNGLFIGQVLLLITFICFTSLFFAEFILIGFIEVINLFFSGVGGESYLLIREDSFTQPLITSLIFLNIVIYAITKRTRPE